MVGVFDSGIGGLSVLREAQSVLPQAHFVYVADSANAPYGERDDAWLQARCLVIANHLRTLPADLLLMACNTATAAATPNLRSNFPAWPIVGIEPGIKPAVQKSRTKRVGVMATAGTLGSARYSRLLAEHGQGAHVVAQPCTGLAMAIETGDESRIAELVKQHTEPLRRAEVDVVVLGCTHCAFASQWISRAMGPEVAIIDTAKAVARHAASLVKGMQREVPTPHEGATAPELWEPHSPLPTFLTTGQPQALERFANRWLGWTIKAQSLPTGPG